MPPFSSVPNTARQAFGGGTQQPSGNSFAGIAGGLRSVTRNLAAGFAKDPAVREQYQQQNFRSDEIDQQRQFEQRQQDAEGSIQNFRELAKMAAGLGAITPSLAKMIDKQVQHHGYLTGDADGAAQMGDLVRMAATLPQEQGEADYQNVIAADGTPLGMINVNDQNAIANLPPGAQLGGTAAALPGQTVQAYEFGKALAGRSPGSTTNVNVQQESAAAAAIGRGLGEAYVDWQKAGAAAVANIAKNQRLGALLAQIQGGKFTGTTNEVKKAAKAAGFDLDTWGVTDDTALVDAAQAISREMALQLRNPAGGAGMPGAMSDADRAFLESMVAGVDTDPDAAQNILAANAKIEQRNKDVARVSREYKKANGGVLDDGVYDAIAGFAATNPIFGNAEQQSGGAGAAPQNSGGNLSRQSGIPTFADPSGPAWQALPSGSAFRDNAGTLRFKK